MTFESAAGARAAILQAFAKAPRITASGQRGLLAIAAHAVDPNARTLAPEDPGRVLGFHDCLMVAITTASELARDTVSRKNLGATIFRRLPLRPPAPTLTARGQLTVARFGLEQLMPRAASELGEPLRGVLRELRRVLIGDRAAASELQAIERQCAALARSRSTLLEKSPSSRAGSRDLEAIRLHSTNAVIIVTQALRASGISSRLPPIVAAEVTASLALAADLTAAAEFIVGLGDFLDGLPPDLALRR
jgi:hypothetical protein